MKTVAINCDSCGKPMPAAVNYHVHVTDNWKPALRIPRLWKSRHGKPDDGDWCPECMRRVLKTVQYFSAGKWTQLWTGVSNDVLKRVRKGKVKP